MNRSTFLAGLAVSAVALFLPGCTNNGASDTSGTSSTTTGGTTAPSGGGSGEKIPVAFVTNNASDFWTIARRGTDQASKELPDVELQFVLPGEGSAAEQKTLVEGLLSKGVKAIAISPVDPKNQTDWLNTVADRAILLTQDSDAPKSKRLCYIGTDNVAAGKQAGELIKKALPGGGKIMLFVGKRDAENARQREEGIRESLKGSNVSVVDVRTDETDRSRAKSNVSDALVKYPDLAAGIGLWSYNGPAILSAVQEANKTGKVKIVCFDEEKPTIAGIKSGDIYATVVQQPYQFGYEAVKMMADLAKGDKSGLPANGQKIVETQAITKENVEEFEANLNKQRGGS